MLHDYGIKLVNMLVDGRHSHAEALRQLAEVWSNLDAQHDFQVFAQLYWAVLDLEHFDFSYEWPGATRANIDDIIRQTALDWLNRFTPAKK